jgi:hypothetical protein
MITAVRVLIETPGRGCGDIASVPASYRQLRTTRAWRGVDSVIPSTVSTFQHASQMDSAFRATNQPDSRMTQRRAYRVLWWIAVAAGLWAALAALSGPDFHLGALRVSSRSPYRPLVLAATSGLIAWALSLAGTAGDVRARPGTRSLKFVALLALMIVTLNILLLAQPSPPPPPFNGCVFDNDMGRGFHHFLNCDSPEYLGLSKHPSLVWTHGLLQARPLSFTLPYLLSQALRLVPYLETNGPYTPFAREFAAFILINLVALTAALVCFTRVLEAGTGTRTGIELFVALVILAANDVTKLFFWTPHTQIFILLVPCLSLYLTFRLLERGTPFSPLRALVTGLALGVGVLIYGSFVIPALCLAAIHVLLFRRLWPAALLCAGALLPYGAWGAYVYSQLGVFVYNHEASYYRHFVWMLDCARVSLASCVPTAQANWTTFFMTAAPILVVPALLLCGLRVIRYVSPGDTPPSPPSLALGRAIATTFTTILIFMMLEGRYAPRLCWLLVPPVLMAVAVELQAIRLSRPRARLQWLNAGIAVVAITYVVLLASRQGPFN